MCAVYLMQTDNYDGEILKVLVIITNTNLLMKFKKILEKHTVIEVYTACREMDYFSDENKSLTELISSVGLTEHNEEEVEFDVAAKVMMLERKLTKIEKDSKNLEGPYIKIDVAHWNSPSVYGSYNMKTRVSMTVKELSDMIVKKRCKDCNVPIQKAQLCINGSNNELKDETVRLGDVKYNKGQTIKDGDTIYHKWITE